VHLSDRLFLKDVVLAWFQNIGRHLLYACRSEARMEEEQSPLASWSVKARVPRS
jgi:hypothetical protein